jgi:tripartite-type tricarboxylate transporter receptor subunit TctC
MLMTRRIMATAALLASVAVPLAAEAYPDKPIRVIIPVVAGGSTDLVARTLQAAIERLKALPQPMVIVNNGAAGGTAGTRMIKEADPDGHTIGVWHMGLLTAPAMNVVDYDHTAYELVAQLGVVPVGLGVKTDSPYKDLKDFIDAARAKPNQVTVAMNIGLLPHFVPLMLAREAGVQFRFVQSGGGALRMKSVTGGHTEMSLFSVPEFIAYEPQGIRPIVLLADKRDERLSAVKTGAEYGYKTVFTERVMMLAPKGVAAAKIKVLHDALSKAMADAEVTKKFAEQGVDGKLLFGPELKPILDAAMVEIKAVAAAVKAAQTN